MAILIACSDCGRRYELDDAAAGKVAQCQCGRNLSIPPPIPRRATEGENRGVDDSSVGSIVEERVGCAPPATPPALPKRGDAAPSVNRREIIIIGGVAVAVVLLIVGLAVHSGVRDPLPLGPTAWDTPEDVFEAKTRAIARRDWKTFYETYAPDEQRRFTRALIAYVAQLARQVPAYRELYFRFGLGKVQLSAESTDDPARIARTEDIDRAITDQVADPRAFCDAVMDLMMNERTPDAFGIARTRRRIMKSERDARLTDVRITGERATGKAVTVDKGRPQRYRVKFVKIDGQWRIGES